MLGAGFPARASRLPVAGLSPLPGPPLPVAPLPKGPGPRARGRAARAAPRAPAAAPVSYTHLRAHETSAHL
eukprot:2497533-Alexandrium_andersonii.AAC.1